MLLGELCNRTVVIGHAGDAVLESARRMRNLHVGSLVVVDESERGRVPVGVVTDWDLLFALASVEPERLQTLRLGEVASWDVITGSEHEHVNEALERMRVHGIRRLPVVDERGTLVGILAYDDLVEWVGAQIGDLARLVGREQRQERAS